MFHFMILAASKPLKTVGGTVDNKKNVKDPNRGFKVDISGKLIIEEPKRGKQKGDTDSEDSDLADEEMKKVTTEESDSDDEIAENKKAKSRKRKAGSSLSQVSGKTGTSGKYVAGGKGIHRQLNDATSTQSGYTNVSGKTDASKKSTAYGSEYRSKKSSGDIKKKGANVDPYAYIPLSRNTLNKRKRAKHSGQFKNIVNAARKGATAGAKRRKVSM